MQEPCYKKPLNECTVAIAGLGLMGGSLGLALRAHVGRVVGIARRPDSLRQAVVIGAIDEGYQDLAEGMAQADIVVLATPISVILQQLADISQLAKSGHGRQGALVLDLGSTKAQVCEAMERLPEDLQPLGGHPMCGKELAGLDVAEAGLYQGAPFVLCPLERTVPDALALGKALALAAGACPVVLEASRHDHLVAAVSHLPYVLSTALFATAHQVARADGLAWQLAASGFRSTTRLAGSEDKMMTDILLTNREAVVTMIDSLRVQLDQLASLIENGDEAQLHRTAAMIRAARAEFLDRFGS